MKMIRSKKRQNAWETAAEKKIRLLEHQLRRTQDTAVSLENVAAKYRDENKQLKELVESLRWRIFTLLKSTNVDAEIFGLPKYNIDPEREYDDEESVEAFFNELQRLSERYHVETEIVDAGDLKKNYLKEATQKAVEENCEAMMQSCMNVLQGGEEDVGL